MVAKSPSEWIREAKRQEVAKELDDLKRACISAAADGDMETALHLFESMRQAEEWMVNKGLYFADPKPEGGETE